MARQSSALWPTDWLWRVWDGLRCWRWCLSTRMQIVSAAQVCTVSLTLQESPASRLLSLHPPLEFNILRESTENQTGSCLLHEIRRETGFKTLSWCNKSNAEYQFSSPNGVCPWFAFKEQVLWCSCNKLFGNLFSNMEACLYLHSPRVQTEAA